MTAGEITYRAACSETLAFLPSQLATSGHLTLSGTPHPIRDTTSPRAANPEQYFLLQAPLLSQSLACVSLGMDEVSCEVFIPQHA